MDTLEFQQAAHALLTLASERYCAIMCAEARPEQCHRRLIADWLVVHGIEVAHVISARRTVVHQLTEFARLEGERIIYDGGLLHLD